MAASSCARLFVHAHRARVADGRPQLTIHREAQWSLCVASPVLRAYTSAVHFRSIFSSGPRNKHRLFPSSSLIFVRVMECVFWSEELTV
jgi:hypothetical protein